MMDTNVFFLFFFILCVLGVVVSAVVGEETSLLLSAWIGFLASLSLLIAAGGLLLNDYAFHISLWQLPYLGQLSLGADRLSALFIFVTALVYLPVSVYSSAYMKKYRNRYSLKSFTLFSHLLFASIILILLAGDVVLFLIGWEAMSILSYFLVSYEHERSDNVLAGFIMLAMGELGTLAVIVGFLLLGAHAANLDFDSLRMAGLDFKDSLRWAVFLLTFFGFGVKAGLVPVNSWLPRAHPAAPGNVSAILSGVILNLGIYGIIRVNGDLLPIVHQGPGLVVLAIGAVSAFVGILYATTENDMKKMLAHSSIENMGIITVGLGASFLFKVEQHPELAGIALIVALYHMVNHSMYKSLLFLGAGVIDSQVGSRDMNVLGGLIKRMPWTSFFFLIGALSIAALPPFCGFVSEWLTLQVLLQSGVLSSMIIKISFALCGAVLAITVGLAVTCFVKAFAMSFLGRARSRAAEKAVEAGSAIKFAMGYLSLLCLLFGILPTAIIPLLDDTVSPLVHVSVVDELVPPFFDIGKGNERFKEAFVSEFHDLGAQVGQSLLPVRGLVVLHQGSEKNPVIFAMSTAYTLIVLVLLVGGTYIVVSWFGRKRTVVRKPVWAGGIRHLYPDMTYTATGFSNPVRVVFDAVFRPTMVEGTKETVESHFRTAIGGDRHEIHLVDRIIYWPAILLLFWVARKVGRIHGGKINVYATYVLLTLLLFLLVDRLF